MTRFRIAIFRILALFRRNGLDRQLDQEIQSHIEMQTEDNLRSGMTPDEARRHARLSFGGTEQIKEEYRDRLTPPFIETLRRDFHYAFRVLRKNPSFSLVAIVSLAMGIGANTAIFSVLNTVTLRSLAVKAPDELFMVVRQGRGVSNLRFSYPMFEQFRSGMAGAGEIAAMSRVARPALRIDGLGESEFANVQLVSGEYFQTLGVDATLGRLLGAQDNSNIGGHPVVVISDSFWRRRFAAAPDVVGKGVSLNGSYFTIVGVGPSNFNGVWLELPTEIWIPLVMQNDIRYAQNFSANHANLDKPWLTQDNIWWLDVILRPRNTSSAAAALDSTFRQLIVPASQGITDSIQRQRFLDQRLTFQPFGRGLSILRQRFTSPLTALMAMVALLLLIACANTANLLLARAAARQRELAVRLSLGASRSRLIRQLLVESSLVAVAAAAAGLAMTPWLSNLLIRRTIGISSGPAPFTTDLDLRVLAFTIALSILTTLMFGLAPAFRSTRIDVTTSLKNAVRGVHSGSRFNITKFLVVAQVALSLVLIFAAALSIRSLRNLARAELGFDREHMVSVWLRIGTVQAGHSRIGNYTAEELPGLYRRLIETAESVPGVRSASVAMCGLVSNCVANNDGIMIASYEKSPGERILVQENRVGPHYFSTVGMRLLAGREIDDRDDGTASKVAVVNEAFVRRYFASRTAIGERFGDGKPDTEIVGVVADARVNAVREDAAPMAYYPIEQPTPAAPGSLDVRTNTAPQFIGPELRRALLAVEPNLLIERVTTLSDQVSNNLNPERLIAGLSSLFGGLALALACFGLYGVMSYAVTRRSGVRMALGASQSRVLAIILKESLLLVLVGLTLGIGLVFVLQRLLSAMLFGISATDPATILMAAFLLTIVAAASACVPAWRASRVDPMIALRYE